jgi:hypothetical protein
MQSNVPFRDKLLTATEAAEWASKLGNDGKPSARAIMDLHRAGKFPGFHVGGEVRFLPRAIEAFLAHKAGLPKDVIKLMNSENE